MEKERTLMDLRKERGSLVRAERLTGINRSQLSRYERGLAVPSYSVACVYARYLETTPEEVQRLATLAAEQRVS